MYSTLVGQALGLGGATTGAWWYAARWPTSTPSAPRPGLVAVVAVLFGSTAFDSFKDSAAWVQPRPGSIPFAGHAARPTSRCSASAWSSGVLFAGACVLTAVGPGRPGARCRPRSRTRSCRSSSATSWPTTSTLLVEVGQVDADPAQRSVLHRRRLVRHRQTSAVSYWLSYHPTLLATIKVLAVVLGHVVGVVAAHDRASRCSPGATS